MGERPPLFVLIPMVIVVKLIFWIAICYRCSDRYRNSRTTIIQQTVIQGQVDNGITGIQNPGYMQQPPIDTEILGQNATQASVPLAYDQNTKSPCFAENYSSQRY